MDWSKWMFVFYVMRITFMCCVAFFGGCFVLCWSVHFIADKIKDKLEEQRGSKKDERQE